jgi:hypothetical protein
LKALTRRPCSARHHGHGHGTVLTLTAPVAPGACAARAPRPSRPLASHPWCLCLLVPAAPSRAHSSSSWFHPPRTLTSRLLSRPARLTVQCALHTWAAAASLSARGAPLAGAPPACTVHAATSRCFRSPFAPHAPRTPPRPLPHSLACLQAAAEPAPRAPHTMLRLCRTQAAAGAPCAPRNH